MSTLEIELTWENNISFKMRARTDKGNWVTILETDENQHLASVWDNYVTGICKGYLETKLAQIGNEMKA